MSTFQEFSIHDDQPQAPCLSCNDRAAGCHTSCRRYQLFRQICRDAAKKRKAEIDARETEVNRFCRKDGAWTHRKKR